MSLIVRTIEAYVGEIVRIVWTKRTALAGNPDPAMITTERLEEDHTAPPNETWKARKDLCI